MEYIVGLPVRLTPHKGTLFVKGNVLLSYCNKWLARLQCYRCVHGKQHFQVINNCRRFWWNRFRLKSYHKITWHWLISSVHAGAIVQRSTFAAIYCIGFYASYRMYLEIIQRLAVYPLFDRVFHSEGSVFGRAIFICMKWVLPIAQPAHIVSAVIL